MAARPDITAWRPRVEGIDEVFHAHFADHAYPMHTHDSWTLLIVDEGMVRYDLDRHEHGAPSSVVSLLPPHIPHNGDAVTPEGFRKRVLYLNTAQIAPELIGRAVDRPALHDPQLRHRIHQLHLTLERPGDELEAQSRLALVSERLAHHLRDQLGVPRPARDRRVARELRALLDRHYVEGLTLREAAERLHTHHTHLVRAFSREYGMAPHQYLTGRRIDLARRLLLGGMRAPDVASSAGFYDQSHFSRHFKRVVGTSPGHYARTGTALYRRSSEPRTNAA
ncbi:MULTISPECIES: helix-turn-helix transcriptional regulator [Streptomyces]|uniref:helix-turn-helix transcriptional regulator n=1 Tax=Streptomyces TaxID=1883 RepID=UPI0007014906|nr:MULTISPECIES: AraC family transcriptional regulator [Streptomyces]KQX91523.1 AraC family transcriptional regulator [Streptomyces sp. Root1319]KQZ20082.1 AraC family transcriptional regulator [Streptomyces sp. Root55]RPK72380.1 Virulence regulon transcriptional activator VirF [Streptomyces sp. ADI97-07]WRY80324.1 AraC family transcriptional regulator [Streptomyces clavifer]WUC26102.1 AraC family transcriptional regulator [Streptomyces clavifer]